MLVFSVSGTVSKGPFVDLTPQGFVEELGSAPADAAGALRLLATLYGLSRVERGAAFFLGAEGCGFTGAHARAVRCAVNAACAALSADSGRLALRLADGFGMPDHCIEAPIAFDWRQIGSELGAF